MADVGSTASHGLTLVILKVALQSPIDFNVKSSQIGRNVCKKENWVPLGGGHAQATPPGSATAFLNES